MQRSNAPLLNAPDILKWLAGTLVFIHLVRWLLPTDIDNMLLVTFAFDASVYGPARDTPYAIVTMIAGPVTHVFLHAPGIMHIVMNSALLLAFGAPLARRMGTPWFAAFFVFSAVAGAAGWFVLNPWEQGLLIGASGGVSGLMGGYARLGMQKRPARGGPMSPRDQRLAAPFAAVWIGLNFFFGFFGATILGLSSKIAWEAHLGGFIFGVLAINYFDGRGRGQGGHSRPARFEVIDGDMD